MRAMLLGAVLALAIAGPAAADGWYYADGARKVGPVAEAALRERLSSGEVPAAALVWRKGMADWAPASEVAALRSQPAAGATLRLRPRELVDANAPFGRMPVATLMLPEGWGVGSRVIWQHANGCFGGPNVQWQAYDRKAGLAVRGGPQLSWGWNATPGAPAIGCIRLRAEDGEALFREMVRKDGRSFVKIDRPPELRPLKRQIERALGTMGVPGVTAEVDAVLGTSRRGGGEDARDVETLLVTVHKRLFMPGVYGSPPLDIRYGRTLMVLEMEAPAGGLEAAEPVLGTVLASYRPNPRWNRGVAGFWRAAAEAKRRASRNRPSSGNDWAQTSRTILDNQMESFNKRMASDSEMSRRTTNALTDTETFQTSDGPRDFSGFYDQTWELKDGSFVQTDDPNFDPFAATGQFGTQLRSLDR